MLFHVVKERFESLCAIETEYVIGSLVAVTGVGVSKVWPTVNELVSMCRAAVVEMFPGIFTTLAAQRNKRKLKKRTRTRQNHSYSAHGESHS